VNVIFSDSDTLPLRRRVLSLLPVADSETFNVIRPLAANDTVFTPEPETTRRPTSGILTESKPVPALPFKTSFPKDSTFDGGFFPGGGSRTAVAVTVVCPLLATNAGLAPYAAVSTKLPAATGVNATEHSERSEVAVASVQLAPGAKLPAALEDRLTVPVGGTGAAWVSTTVTMHVLAVPTCTEPGAQTTAVLVGSGGNALIESVACAELPLKPVLPTNDAVTVRLPA
jgi:hypothetical protein